MSTTSLVAHALQSQYRKCSVGIHKSAEDCITDRTRLYGLEEDLGLHGNQFQILVSVLFVTYILSELPSNLVIKKVGPSRWIAFIALSWGLVATFSGSVQNFAGMLVCRLLLGAFEGGLFPGIVVYLTLFYTKRELALRIGYLFTCAAVAGACGGLLAYAIGFMDGKFEFLHFIITCSRVSRCCWSARLAMDYVAGGRASGSSRLCGLFFHGRPAIHCQISNS